MTPDRDRSPDWKCPRRSIGRGEGRLHRTRSLLLDSAAPAVSTGKDTDDHDDAPGRLRPAGSREPMGRGDPWADQAVRGERRRERRGAPRPSGMRLRLPRSQRRRQDHAHPGAAGTDARRCRHDVPARIPRPQASRRGTGTGRSHRRRAPFPRASDRAGRTSSSSLPPASRRRGTASVRRSSGSACSTAPTTGCRSTRWACASASGWRPACSGIRSC